MENKDLLNEIIKEQIDFDSKVRNRLQYRYDTQMGRLFGKAEAMQNEVGEIKEELKPFWQWWRGSQLDISKLELTEEQKKRLIQEAIDVMKFNLSFLLELGINSSEKLYNSYMEKHKIIHQRLEDANSGKDDNYMII